MSFSLGPLSAIIETLLALDSIIEESAFQFRPTQCYH